MYLQVLDPSHACTTDFYACRCSWRNCEEPASVYLAVESIRCLMVNMMRDFDQSSALLIMRALSMFYRQRYGTGDVREEPLHELVRKYE